MKKETKIMTLILSVAVILCVAVSGWILSTAGNEQSLVVPVPPETPLEGSLEISTEIDMSKYEIKGNVPDEVKPLDEDKTTSVTVTKDEDGNKAVENNWDKPKEPEKPSVDDDQLTNPGKEPEYTPPEQPKETTPKGGEQNGSGQVYVPGFGWVTPSKDSGYTGVDAGGDPNKQVGMM